MHPYPFVKSFEADNPESHSYVTPYPFEVSHLKKLGLHMSKVLQELLQYFESKCCLHLHLHMSKVLLAFYKVARLHDICSSKECRF